MSHRTGIPDSPDQDRVKAQLILQSAAGLFWLLLILATCQTFA